MAFSLLLNIPVLSWIAALLAQSSLTRESLVQFIVYQNTLLLLCFATWLICRLTTHADRDPNLPLFHPLSTKAVSEPIMILVTKSVTTKVEHMSSLPTTETRVESSSSRSQRCTTFCH